MTSDKTAARGGQDPRRYRRQVASPDLVLFRVTMKETDLLVSAEKDLTAEVRAAVWKYRRQIEGYIGSDSRFKEALTPLEVDSLAPRIVREMAAAAKKAGVGPMAAVAGAVAEFAGRELLLLSPQIILENGGDIFMATGRERRISILTEQASLPQVDLLVRPEKTPVGICTSSGKEGPSLSLGRADAVTVISPSALLADAAATAAGNLVQSKRDVQKALDFLRALPGVTGGVVLMEGEMGFWGEIEIL